ncbi:hypothetical protein ACJZ2D_007669 [Fusarium nematophilum]
MASSEFICANCNKAGNYSCKNCLLVVADCRSLLGKPAWQPAWVLENRTPAFVGPGVGQQFGGNKFLWGNVPALDVLQLGSNEGEGYTGDLRLLFAASGDLRNLVKTIARLLGTYTDSIEAMLNDRDIDVVARNIIFLLIALVVDDSAEAVDSIIHIWYSTFARKSDIGLIQQRIRPLIGAVCEKIKDRVPGSLQGKTWSFGQLSLRVVLEKSSSDRLLDFFDLPPGLTVERAQEFRASVTMAEPRNDYRDRRLDCANPISGWPSNEVAETSSGPATADIYGKLFYHLRESLGSFLSQLSRLNIKVELLNVDALSLRGHLGGIGASAESSQTTQRLLKFLSPSRRGISTYDPEIFKFGLGREVVATYDDIFNWWV